MLAPFYCITPTWQHTCNEADFFAFIDFSTCNIIILSVFHLHCNWWGEEAPIRQGQGQGCLSSRLGIQIKVSVLT